MSQKPKLWTLEELVEKVREALDEAGLEQSSGRVRSAPDGRTIRYYTTLGLVDRPAAVRQRRRLYSERHLQQVLAIKRLQADGLSLAEVQRRLLDAEAEVLAELSERPPVAKPEGEAQPGPRAFWRLEPSRPPAEPDAGPGRGRGAPVTGAYLGEGVTVLITGMSRALSDDERRELASAAEPLLEHIGRIWEGET